MQKSIIMVINAARTSLKLASKYVIKDLITRKSLVTNEPGCKVVSSLFNARNPIFDPPQSKLYEKKFINLH